MRSYNQSPVLRDVQVAQEIRDMAALGKFPQEITVYGLAYYKHGERYYMISGEPESLIVFASAPEHFEYFPTPIQRYAKRQLIPEGEKENLKNTLKIKLALQLEVMYPLSHFQALAQQKKPPANAEVKYLIDTMRQDLEPVFSREKIEAFQGICVKAYMNGHLSEGEFLSLQSWYQKRLLELEQFLLPEYERQRTYYGFAVIDQGQIADAVVNANLWVIYQKQMTLAEKGALVTTWHAQRVTGNIGQAQDAVKEMLYAIYDAAMSRLLTAVYEKRKV